MNSKVCTKCNIDKDLTNYYKHKLGKLGYRSECKSCEALRNKKYRIENVEKTKEINKNYREKNKEKEKEYSKKYRLENIEKERERKRKYIKFRKSIDPIFKVKCKIKNTITLSIREKGYLKKSRTHEILGCDYEFFKQYLESKFEDWMSWENHGKYNGELNYGWDIDHIIPLASAKTEDDVIRLNHYTNLQPLCSKVNRHIKSDKI